MKTKRKGVSYAKWGYVFILPFFISFYIIKFSKSFCYHIFICYYITAKQSNTYIINIIFPITFARKHINIYTMS